MALTVPEYTKKYFWGDNLNDLSWPKHKKYIIQTLLEKGELDSLKWLFQNVSKEEVLELLPELRLLPKSSNFWHIYLS